MVPEKAASDLEWKRSIQVTMIRKSSLLSYYMRGDYTLEPLAYGVNCRGARFFLLVEAPSDKYIGKDRSHRTCLINL